MNLPFRAAGSLLVSIGLILAVAGPAGAVNGSGEPLTSSGTDCGVLTVDPNTPLIGQNLTLSLTGAQPTEIISLGAAPGLLIDNRWYSILGQDADPADGLIGQTLPVIATPLDTTVDADGNVSLSGTVSQLLSDDPNSQTDLAYTLIPLVWVATCEAGYSFATMRGARASLTGTLALDPETPGSITGFGLPANLAITGILANLGGYPDPGTAVWSAVQEQAGLLNIFSLTSDADGTVASTPAFDPITTPAGRYAVAFVVLDQVTPRILKGEYVLTIADDGAATLELWDKPVPTPEPTEVPVPTEPPAVTEATVLSILLNARIGDVVAGTTVDYTATGLLPGSPWTLTERPTSQIIASGIVAPGGRLAGSAVIPAGLTAGWHSLTLAGTSAANTPVESATWFLIGTAGQLIQVSSTAPALAETGTPTLTAAPLAGGLLLLGFAVTLLAARRRQSNASIQQPQP
ncbi:hypothetical protein [Cryobacterium sp. CG_9.6]|uniref:hypothetical protein n=1 Tax=Cryobacterium sp. CG_9.6 TaxID=2760710 RepID=UPI00247548BE|nr:hypothetical protein [Cryobacterium sp. CG_9.6]MDH6237737.1 hypothetical protein [Cryobacterium sp. CG_9.6]